MNPVKIGTGKSFKGLSTYLLHDPQAQTSDRVGWAQSYNLAGADPDRAWRLMADTALSANQIKEAAGYKAGKRPANVAYHFSLSFNPADRPGEALQREAVTGALKSLGLENHQAMAVSHTDTGHAHIHVMVNLIDPQTGYSAASKQPGGKPALLSNDTRKLSAWAARFEREHGLVVTQGRQDNAQKRSQGEPVNAKRKTRKQFEQEQAEARAKVSADKRQAAAQSAKELSTTGYQQRARHRAEWEMAKAGFQDQKKTIYREFGREIDRRAQAIIEEYKPAWRVLYDRQHQERAEFERGDRTALGRIWHSAAVIADRARDGDMLGGFLAAFSKEERQAIVMRKHDREQKSLAARIRGEIQEATREPRNDRKKALRGNQRNFLGECEQIKQRQNRERAELRNQWQALNDRRRAAALDREARKAQMMRELEESLQRQARDQSRGYSR